MAKIIFFEKPGCINNTKQKELLTLAGHHVTAVNILKHKWDYEQLTEFFNGNTQSQWFNKNAPMIKNGFIDPQSMTDAELLQKMLENPLLINRPLMQIGKEKIVGFDLEKLATVISLTPISNISRGLNLMQSDFANCPITESKMLECSSEPKC